MAEKFNNERLADVIPIHRHRRLENIAGLMLDLAAMSTGELMLLYGQCAARRTEANQDLAIVEEYIDQRGDV